MSVDWIYLFGAGVVTSGVTFSVGVLLGESIALRAYKRATLSELERFQELRDDSV